MSFRFFARMDEQKTGEEGGGAGTATPATATPTIDPTTQLNGQTAPETATQTAPAAPTPIYKGLGGSFTSTEELTKYVAELEANVAKNILEGQRPKQPQKTAQEEMATAPAEVDISPDQLFEDPAAFVSKLEEKILKKLKAEDETKKKETAFWEGFYLENPELKNYDRAVKSVMNEKWGYLQKLPVSEAKKILASEALGFVNSIRGTEGQRVIMTGSAGGTLQNSFATHQDGGQQVNSKPSSFLDEMRSLTKKRKS